jgi:flagellar hook-length control protein FliK
VSVAIAPPASSSPAADTRGGFDRARAFDDHLDAARQQQDPRSAQATPDRVGADRGPATDATDNAARASTAAQDDAVAPSDTVPHAAGDASADLAASATKPALSDDDTPLADGSSVASAMLALLGQAAPAAASLATGGAAKVLAASALKASLGTPATAAGAADLPAPGLAETASGDAGEAAPALAQPPAALTANATALAEAFAGGVGKGLAHKPSDEHALQDLSLLAGAAPQPTANTGVMPPHALQITSPVASAGFAHELGQQVAWLGGQDIKQAKIRLHPEELGQLDVKVSVQHNGQVDVTFAAQHPAAVHALQQTLPQLDALLAQHGLSLGQADVGQRQAGSEGRSEGSFPGRGEPGEAGDAVIERVASVSTEGLLDAFA